MHAQHAHLRESMSAPASPTFQKVLHSQQSSSVNPPAVPSHALAGGNMHDPHAYITSPYAEQSPADAAAQHGVQHTQHGPSAVCMHSRSPVHFKAMHAATASTGAAAYGNTSPLSPGSPSSVSGTSAFNASGAESDFEGGDSARIGTNPTPCTTDASLLLDSGYEEPLDSMPAGTLNPNSRTRMHENTMPHSHASAAHRAALHKRAVSDFDFSGMHTPQDPYASVVMGQPQWLKGDEVDGERDISSEFDVTMVLGDLNYRCATFFGLEQPLELSAANFITFLSLVRYLHL